MRDTVIHALRSMLLLTTTAAHAITLGLAPVSQTVAVGTQLDVALQISGLGEGAAPSLSTFDVDVTFSGSLLSFASAAFGDPGSGDQLDLSGLGSVTAVSPAPSAVNLFELSLDLPADLVALQAASFTLATLTFTAQAPGTSSLAITVNALGDANGVPLFAELVGASVTGEGAAAVDEPESLLLAAAALLALVQALQRRTSMRTHAANAAS